MREQFYWQGTKVPYVASWSSEEKAFVGQCEHSGGREAIFRRGARGEGKPVWGKMDETRQRETCALQRCQVCNCKLRGERAFGMDVPGMMSYRGKVYQVLIEPPTCLHCTRYSLERCPGLRKREEEKTLRCYEVFSYAAIGQILGPVEGGNTWMNELLKPHQQVIGYHKCLLTIADQLTLDELKDRVK